MSSFLIFNLTKASLFKTSCYFRKKKKKKKEKKKKRKKEKKKEEKEKRRKKKEERKEEIKKRRYLSPVFFNVIMRVVVSLITPKSISFKVCDKSMTLLDELYPCRQSLPIIFPDTSNCTMPSHSMLGLFGRKEIGTLIDELGSTTIELYSSGILKGDASLLIYVFNF